MENKKEPYDLSNINELRNFFRPILKYLGTTKKYTYPEIIISILSEIYSNLHEQTHKEVYNNGK